MQKTIFIILVFLGCFISSFNLNAQLFNNKPNNSPFNLSIENNTTEPDEKEETEPVEEKEKENNTSQETDKVEEKVEETIPPVNTTKPSISNETDITEEKEKELIKKEKEVLKKEKVKNIKKKVESSVVEKASSAEDRLIFEIAHSNWYQKPVNFELDWYSRSFNAYFMYDFDLNGNRNVSFAPGIGLGTSIISHNNRLSVDTSGVTRFIQFADSSSTSTFDYSRNNLVTAYLDIPIELRFRLNPDKNGNRWKLAVGFKGGYLFNSHTKYVGNNPDDLSGKSIKEKIYKLQNINNFRYGPTLRFGYGNYNLIGFFSLSTLFQKDLAERNIQPFYIGFSFNSL